MPLGTPDVLVCSVGTEIFFEAGGASPQPDRKWAAKLAKGWDPAAAGGNAGLRTWACA